MTEPMDSTPVAPPAPTEPRHTRNRRMQVARLVAGLALLYVVAAYLVIPFATERYFRRHPSLDDIPGVTQTGDGHPGDPLNVALIGTEAEVKAILKAAQWHPADPLGLRSDLEIAGATVLRREYDDAPVSSLYLFGRKEDLAFEQPVGGDPRKRNHVRFWRAENTDPDGRPVWVGSATFDERVGLSHTTGQITHHIAPDVDAERDRLFQDLQQTGDLSETYVVDGFHKTLKGRNGGGDPWYTNGDLYVGVIGAESQR